MEYLPHGYTLDIPEGCFPLSTDSMALAHFVKLPINAQVLDLGSGCGTLGLLLCAKDPLCRVTGLELTERAHQAALENIRRNELTARMESICADLRSVSRRFSPGSFSCCVSNPPYFSGGASSQSLPLARQEDACSIPELMAAASWALKFGGDFFLVHKAERLGNLIAAGAPYRLEAKRACILRHKAGSPINLILLQFRKGAKPGLQWEELILHNADGSPTPQYLEIYHMEEA